MKKYVALTIIVTAALLIGLTGCSTSKTTTSTTGTSTSANTVNIANYTFVPDTLTVSVGTTVTWTNSDAAIHRIASDTGVFDSGDLSQNAVFSYTFNNAGAFPYHCTIHTYMKGTIIVK